MADDSPYRLISQVKLKPKRGRGRFRRVDGYALYLLALYGGEDPLELAARMCDPLGRRHGQQG